MRDYVALESLLDAPIRNGLTKPSRIRGTGVKMISMGEIFSFDRIGDIPMELVPATKRELESSGIRKGDLLFARQSLVLDGAGKCSIVTDVCEPTVFESHLIRVRINNNKALPEFIYYYFKSSEGKGKIRGIVEQVAAAGIRGKDLIKLQVPCPSLDIQKSVVAILNRFDNLANINSRTNDYLEQCLLARYDHFFGHAGSYDGTVSDIGDVVGGATPSKKKPEYYCHDGIGWITPRDLSNTSDKFIAHGADDITQMGFESCSVKKLPAGTVLFSSRAPIGYMAIATDEVTTNQGFKSIVPRPEIGTAFVYCFLARNKDRIADAGSGTTFPEVSGKTMAGIELALPDIELCAEFEEWAAPLLEHQRNLEEENHQLAKLKDVLLPKLMSGEIDVSQVELPTQSNNHLS